MTVHDVFGQIPPPGQRDGADVHARYEEIASGRATGFDGDQYYGYMGDLKERVTSSFTRFGVQPSNHNITLIAGLFEETVRPTGAVALAHIDGDWYDSVSVCLSRIWPKLSEGGVMVIDDYNDWSGCRTAVDEFLAATPNVRVEHRSRLHLMRA